MPLLTPEVRGHHLNRRRRRPVSRGVPVTTPSRPPQAETSPEHPAAPKRNWPVAAGALTAAAAILVFLALVVPDQLGRIKPGSWVPGAFLRIPIEGIFGAALLTVLPRRPRRVAGVLLGA